MQTKILKGVIEDTGELRCFEIRQSEEDGFGVWIGGDYNDAVPDWDTFFEYYPDAYWKNLKSYKTDKPQRISKFFGLPQKGL